MADYYNEIIEDKTTPDAVLLAGRRAVVKMYPNGTSDVVAGNTNFQGCA